jgi:hypothetical protein
MFTNVSSYAMQTLRGREKMYLILILELGTR